MAREIIDVRVVAGQQDASPVSAALGVHGAAAIVAYCGEVTTHGWDLATAIGRTDLLDDRLADFSAAMARRFVPADPRGGEVPFAPVVPVADDAPPYERLAGWMGRDPTWAA
jgi:uncharacterized protein (TIGR03086 family)